ncbi:GNAT family N-acetyltransferase [Nocardia alni]|uniref:GNAT family N-acetyltransferase n=1 Tax=Nocardia alni TaxID=2815723 RepID=UPI001C2274CD|nr:GNAT family N-acetyltransferase [Nocardia alni]
MIEDPWLVVPHTPEYTRSLAACHIACWREAYRGLVPDHLLAAFDLDHRADQWDRIREKNPGMPTLAVAGTEVIGFAATADSRDDSPPAPRELNAMYVRAAWYGTGAAHALMRAVLDPTVDTSLWVFEENPRAQAFYRKYEFELDGTRRAERFSPTVEVRMIRRADAPR